MVSPRIYRYRGWKITVVAVRAGKGWFATATVRAPGARRSVPENAVVPPVTSATQQDALEEIVRRTRDWIDRYAFGDRA